MTTAQETAQIFIALGFKQEGLERGDFMLRQDIGDAEPYVHWLSDKPCPRPDLVREPIRQPIPPEVIAAKEADRIAREANETKAAEMIEAADLIMQSIAHVDEITRQAQQAVSQALAERDAALARVRELESGAGRSLLSTLSFGLLK